MGWHIDHTVLKYPKALIYLADVNLDVSSIRRRQGFRYFYSEVKLRNLMYRESLISLRDLLINILIRILIQLILPSLLYKKLYQWRRREL